MDTTRKSCVGFWFAFMVFPVVIMQGVGCFSKSLLYTSDCGGVSLVSKCCFSNPSEKRHHFIHHFPSANEYLCPKNDTAPQRLSEKALALQLTSFISSLLFAVCLVIVYILSHFYNKLDDDESVEVVHVILCIAYVVYFISGLFSLLGCWIIAESRPHSSSLGSAYYMSLSSGIYRILQFCFSSACFKKKVVKRKKPRIIVHQPAAMTPSSCIMVQTRYLNAAVPETQGVVSSLDGNVIFYQARRAQVAGPLR